ncbi:MAG: hypothetical protein ACLP9L_31120 [Thermoguttaceae bacterium]
MTVMIAVFLLPSVAASADAAKEAYQKRKAFCGKGDFVSRRQGIGS